MRNFKNVMFSFIAFGLMSAYSCQNDNDPNNNVPPASEIPAELQGAWLEEWSLSMQHEFDPLLYNPGTNKWFGGEYDPWSMDPVPGFGIQINQDGTFIWAIVVATSSGGGCQSYTAEYIKGTVLLEEDQITFYPQVRRMKYHSVCNPGNDFDRNEATDSFTLKYDVSTVISVNEYEVLTFTTPYSSVIKYLKLKS